MFLSILVTSFTCWSSQFRVILRCLRASSLGALSSAHPHFHISTYFFLWKASYEHWASLMMHFRLIYYWLLCMSRKRSWTTWRISRSRIAMSSDKSTRENNPFHISFYKSIPDNGYWSYSLPPMLHYQHIVESRGHYTHRHSIESLTCKVLLLTILRFLASDSHALSSENSKLKKPISAAEIVPCLGKQGSRFFVHFFLHLGYI